MRSQFEADRAIVMEWSEHRLGGLFSDVKDSLVALIVFFAGMMGPKATCWNLLVTLRTILVPLRPSEKWMGVSFKSDFLRPPYEILYGFLHAVNYEGDPRTLCFTVHFTLSGDS